MTSTGLADIECESDTRAFLSSDPRLKGLFMKPYELVLNLQALEEEQLGLFTAVIEYLRALGVNSVLDKVAAIAVMGEVRDYQSFGKVYHLMIKAAPDFRDQLSKLKRKVSKRFKILVIINLEGLLY